MTKDEAIKEIRASRGNVEAKKMAIAALQGIDADECEGCYFLDSAGSAKPCAKCKRATYDYWRANND